MPHNPSRRNVLGLAVGGLGAHLLGTGARAHDRQPTAVLPARFTRYSAFSAEGKQMLISYEKGVCRMKQRVWPDRLSWEFQAAIHGTDTRAGDLLNQCVHGSWWFLPWHRAFIWYFERIIRTLSEDPSFTLPYWPWDDNQTNMLPPEFQVTGSSLRCDRVQNNVDLNSATTRIPSLSVETNDLLTKVTQFTATSGTEGFGGYAHPTLSKGKMEVGIHDAVHSASPGPMYYTVTSAVDPIFWLHHCNIDRLWDHWLAAGHLNPTDPVWLDNLRAAYSTSAPEKGTFITPDDKEEKVCASDVVTGGYVYDYQYDSLPPQATTVLADLSLRTAVTGVTALRTRGSGDRKAMPVEARAELERLFGDQVRIVLARRAVPNAMPLVAGSSTTELVLAEGGRAKFESALGLLDRFAPPGVALQLWVRGVSADSAPGVVYRVYLNERGADAKTDRTTANYVGIMPIFLRSPAGEARAGADHEGGAHHAGHAPAGRDFRFDATALVRRLHAAKALNPDSISVTFAPIGAGGLTTPAAEVTAAQIELILARD